MTKEWQEATNEYLRVGFSYNLRYTILGPCFTDLQLLERKC